MSVVFCRFLASRKRDAHLSEGWKFKTIKNNENKEEIHTFVVNCQPSEKDIHSAVYQQQNTTCNLAGIQ